MVKDAEAHAEDDKQKAEEIEARNRADSLIYQTEKLLSEQKDKLSEEDVKSAEAAIADCKKAVEDGDADRINSAVEALTQASHKIAESMYSQAGATPTDDASSGAESDGGEPADDDVIDAEYVDVDGGDSKE